MDAVAMMLRHPSSGKGQLSTSEFNKSGRKLPLLTGSCCAEIGDLNNTCPAANSCFLIAGTLICLQPVPKRCDVLLHSSDKEFVSAGSSSFDRDAHSVDSGAKPNRQSVVQHVRTEQN